MFWKLPPPKHSHDWFRRNWNTRKPYSKYPTTIFPYICFRNENPFH